MTNERRSLDMPAKSPAPRAQPRRSAYAAALLLASLALPARADMVVIASTAPDVAPGRIVQPGQPLRVPEGAQVTLLASTGATMIMVPPGGTVSDIPSVQGDGQVLTALAAVVAGGSGSTRMGAARAVGDAVCVPRPEADMVQEIARLGVEGCTASANAVLDELRQRRVPASLHLTSATGRKATGKAGQPLRLEVTTSIPAHVACWRQTPDGSVAEVPVEAAPGKPLSSSRPYALRLALEQTGRTLVACAASSRQGASMDAAIALANLQARIGRDDGLLAVDQISVQIQP